MKKSGILMVACLIGGVGFLVTMIVLNLRPDAESLFVAIVKGDLVLVEKAIESGVPVNVKGPEEHAYRSPLHIAIACGHHEIVSYLLRAGADLNNAENMDRATPLEVAVSSDYELTKMLLANGADTGLSPSGESPIVLAAFSDDPRIISLLLSHGAGPNDAGRHGRRALHYVASAEAAMTLFGAGGKLDVQDAGGMTPLMRAAARGKKEVVGALLSMGANADLTDEKGRTALHHAAGALDGTGLPRMNPAPVVIVKMLIDHGCNRDTKDKEGLSARDVAVKLEKEDIQKLLTNPPGVLE